MEHGVPLFLGQLIETLRIEQRPDSAESRLYPTGTHEISLISKMATTAVKYGHELLQGGFTVDPSGFSISRRAVEASGGTLSVREVPSVGCVFTVDLPRYSDEVGRTAGLATLSQPPKAGSRGSAMH